MGIRTPYFTHLQAGTPFPGAGYSWPDIDGNFGITDDRSVVQTER